MRIKKTEEKDTCNKELRKVVSLAKLCACHLRRGAQTFADALVNDDRRGAISSPAWLRILLQPSCNNPILVWRQQSNSVQLNLVLFKQQQQLQ